MINIKKKKQKLAFDKENIDDSKQAKYYLNQGKIKLDKSRTQEQVLQAIQCFNLSLEKSSNTQAISVNNIYNLRGQAYFKIKNYEKAEKDFNEAIHLSDEKTKIPFINALGKCKIEMSATEPIQLEEAYRLFQKAIEISNRTDGQSYLNLGNVNRLMGKTQLAIKQYTNALKLLKNADQFEAYTNRGQCYQELNQIQNGIQDFIKACQIRRDDPQAQFSLGSSYLQIKSYQKALENINRAIELNPKQPKYYNSKGFALSQNQQNQSALIQFNKALSLFSFFQASDCLFNKGNALIKLKRFEEALQVFDKALEPLKVEQELLIKLFYYKGLAFQKMGRIEAIQNFSNCLNTIKQMSHDLYLAAYYHLGLNQHRHSLLRQSVLSFSKIFSCGCYDLCVYEARGKVYLELELFEDALKDFEKITQSDENYPDIYYLKGLAKNNFDMVGQAIDDFHKSLEKGSKNISIFNGLGQAYLRLKKYQKALYYLNIALEKSPVNDEFLVQRSQIYLETNQHLKAIEDLTKALQQRPSSANIYYRRGLAYYKNKSFLQAIADLYKAFQCKPRELIEPDIYYHLGISYANLDQFEEALIPFTKALELNQQPKFYHERAKCYLLTDRNEDALSDFNEVIKKQPNNAYAYFRRAFALKALKRYEQSADDFETARKLKPNDPKLFINKKQIYSIRYKKLCDPGDQE